MSKNYVLLGNTKIPVQFWNDPLYQKVLTSNNLDEYSNAKDILLAIRGSQAIEILQDATKKENK